MRWVVLATVACSAGTSRRDPPPSAPASDEDRDENRSVAWQRAHPDPGAAPPPYMFDWQHVRDHYERVIQTPVGSTPCDFRIRGPQPAGQDCLPGGPRKLAAWVKHQQRVDDRRTRLVLDLGAEATLTPDWVAALLDDQGRPISAWIHPDEVRRWDSSITVDVPPGTVVWQTARVALLEVPP